MKVEIKATTVNQIINADVIGLDQIAALTPSQKEELLAELIQTLQSKSEKIKAQPHGISTEEMRTLAEATGATVNQISNRGDASANKRHIGRLFETFRTYFGEAADLVLTAVKVAQATGMLS